MKNCSVKNLTVNLLSRSEKVLGFSGMRRGTVPRLSLAPRRSHSWPAPVSMPATLTCLSGASFYPPVAEGVQTAGRAPAPTQGSGIPALSAPSASHVSPEARPGLRAPALTEVTKLQGHTLVDLREGRRGSLWASGGTPLPACPLLHPPTLVMKRMVT